VVSVGSSAGKLRIFEPDHGDVPWDAQTYLLEDAHGADRHEVGCGEDRVQVGAAARTARIAVAPLASEKAS
jgi:hypothetical protein